MYVTVEVEHGMLRGQQKTSDYFSHKNYFSFQGIPFAKPPLGPLRFKDPEEPEAWSKVSDALKEGSDCPQFHIINHDLIGSEDCLYLNVYTPVLDGDAKLPVMVWIHGGGFFVGSGSTELYGPEYLMEHDVIIVTVNYRLGVLGFLCLDHNEVAGNAGLKDQAMALRWVQKNIAKFGGDPNRVTIFGESAGAASVFYHLVSPLSQGLFQQAIAQSGSILDPWAYVDRATCIDRAFTLGKALGCDTKDANKLIEFLRGVPVVDLVTKVNTIFCEDEDFLASLRCIFLPCVESPATDLSFLPAPPKECLEQGRFAKVPTIMGSTNAEGILAFGYLDLSEENLPKVYDSFEKYLIRDLGHDIDSDIAKNISKEVKQFYFGGAPVTVQKLDRFLELYGDVMFHRGIDECLRLTVENKEAGPVYAYELNHCLSNSFVKFYMQTMKPGCNFKGVNHAEDLTCLFTHSLEGLSKPSSEDQEFIATITKIWATFAKTGNPTYSGMETTWEPSNKKSFCYLNIGKESKLVPERIKQKRVVFWQQMYDKYASKQ